MLRILTAAVMLPSLWVAIKIAPPSVFSVVALILIGMACWECLGILCAADGLPLKLAGLLGSLAVIWSFLDFPPRIPPELALTGLVVLAIALAVWSRDDPREMLYSAMTTVFAVTLVALGLAYLVRLRSMPGEDGQDLLMLLFICVIFADTAAYYVGTWIGKRRLAPVLSPNKTWEGAMAGLAASVLGAQIAQIWFYQRLPLGHALLLGLLLGMAACFGDLAESLLKRAARVKDASRLIPGHGGVLDRTDSLLFSGPLLYFYYRWFLQGMT
jgi:phosphatidate cytidylyltransferase